LSSVCERELVVIEPARRGSKEAFESIVKMYMKNAYFVALGLVGNRDDALELSQEAFILAYRNIRQLNSNRKFYPLVLSNPKKRMFQPSKEDKKAPELLPRKTRRTGAGR